MNENNYFIFEETESNKEFIESLYEYLMEEFTKNIEIPRHILKGGL